MPGQCGQYATRRIQGSLRTDFGRHGDQFHSTSSYLRPRMSSLLLLQPPDSVPNLLFIRLPWTHESMLRRNLWPARLIRHGSLIRSGAVRSPISLRNGPSPTSTSSPITPVRRFSESTGGSGFQAFDDTIYALSTANGKAGIAVIRISGPSCIDVSLFRSFNRHY